MSSRSSTIPSRALSLCVFVHLLACQDGEVTAQAPLLRAAAAESQPQPQPQPQPGDRVAGKLIMVNDNAGWCWYQDEKIRYDPVTGTIITSTAANSHGYGGVPREGDIDHSSFDPATGERHVVTIGYMASGGRGDDHNMGALWIRPDGRYLHMWAGHNDDLFSYFRLSTQPHDSSAWDPTRSYNWQTLAGRPSSRNVAYSNLHYLSAEGSGQGRLYNIGRGDLRSPNISYSDDLGQTWAYAGKLTTYNAVSPSSYSNGYFKFASNGVDRIDFIATEHHPRNYNNGIYHGYIRGGASFDAFGDLIDPSIFDESAPDPVDFTPIFVPGAEDRVNDTNEHHRAWTIELELGPDGDPVALYSTRFGVEIAANRSGDADHRLFYARFDGTQWHSTELAKMGGPLYFAEQDYTGLGAIHPDNPDLVYISTTEDPRDDTSFAKHEIFKGVTQDRGATWSWTQITFDSTVDNLRPAIPGWDAAHTAVFWLRGDYPSQRRFDQTLVALLERSDETVGLVRYTAATLANSSLADGSPLFTTGPAPGSGPADNRWHWRTDLGDGALACNGSGVEDVPVIRTSVSGVADGTYDVFALFWSDPNEDWRLAGGLAADALLVFRRHASQRAEASQFEGTAPALVDGPAVLYRAYLGRRVVSGEGQLHAYVDEVPSSTPGVHQTAFAGLGLAVVP